MKNTSPFRPSLSLLASVASALTLCGCQCLTYTSPTGERLTRTSFAANTTISSLTLESGTNGVRKVVLHGYKNNSTEAVGAVTEAAVSAAVRAIK